VGLAADKFLLLADACFSGGTGLSLGVEYCLSVVGAGLGAVGTGL